MKKPLLCAALLLLACARAAGQEAGAAEPPPYGRLDDVKAEAARLLESPTNRERAWGAYLAGRHGLKGSAPALVRLLSDPALAAGPEEGLVRQAALDALISLGAKVDAETLRALPQGFTDEALILMARSPEENQAALLETFTRLDDAAHAAALWMAAGNLLAEVKAQGFAARLLAGLKVEADVTVLDADESHGTGRGYGGGGCGCGSSYNPNREFPPVGFYSLTDEAGRDAVVVAPGRRPVFYLRSLAPSRNGCRSLPPGTDPVRVEYLAALLGTTEAALDLDARPSFTVVCKDARECRRGLAGVRRRIEQSYSAVAGLLVEKGLLGGVGDAPASPRMTFTLYDERRRRSFPLPETLKGVNVLVAGTEADAEAQ